MPSPLLSSRRMNRRALALRRKVTGTHLPSIIMDVREIPLRFGRSRRSAKLMKGSCPDAGCESLSGHSDRSSACVRAHEVNNARCDFRPKPSTVEHAIVADTGLQVMHAHLVGNIDANIMRRLRLTDA